MSVLIDTSAFLAIADETDSTHAKATRTWLELIAAQDELVVSSYAVSETISLLQRRVGKNSVLQFAGKVFPILEVVWVDAALHDAAMSAFLAQVGRRSPSLVDCVGFEIARRRQIDTAFAYDTHFEDRGFTLIGQ